MRAIVTGGAGFIGSHLVDPLLADGQEVTVLDNFVCGRRKNLCGLPPDAAVSIVEADVTDHKGILPHFRHVDLVFHLSCLVDIVPSIRDPLRYFTANVKGTVSV